MTAVFFNPGNPSLTPHRPHRAQRGLKYTHRESYLSMASTEVVSCRDLQGRKMSDVLGTLEEVFTSARFGFAAGLSICGLAAAAAPFPS